MSLSANTLKKTSITLKMLIDVGLLHAGQEIFCENPSIKGVINLDGSITVNVDGKDCHFEYLSGAARHIEKRSLNGWLYWHTSIEGEKFCIGSFRDQYLLNEKKPL
ncbi:hypothetical protein SAMN05444410_11451 [Hydrobacter penzbergensis]|uniref:RAMA domain-containing protein n=1 Tax=Hydrobacter penzbergensis TaxID=1235997 RepID=A0A8X8IHF4_9BACT|nr:hypothetical protein [Hydrobacter penzbergensis]SDX36676.1 hypothetical protein SAMN05444410_11451 [Hydrobacter penzbergensis]